MIKTWSLHLTVACLLLGAATGVQAKGCIGFIPSGGGGIFWKGVNSGAIEAGKALGYDIYFRGPQEENQAGIQTAVLEMVRQRGCNALVIAPGSADMALAVEKLQRSGVPVIYVDRTLGAPAATGMVGTDNFKAGQLAGEAMAKRLKGKGAVLLFRMKQGWQTTDQRESGFAEAAARKGLQVIDGGYLGAVYGEAFVNASSALVSQKGRFQGVFAPNEATSMGVLAALRAQRLAGHVTYIGVDVTDQLLEGLQSGAVTGLVVQAAHAIGYQAVQMAVRAVDKKLPANRRVTVDAIYLTQENIDSYIP